MGGPAPRSAEARPARTRRGRATRAALVDAAIELFSSQGVEDTSVDEITARATVAKGTFYVHFQRKQDVLLEWAAGLLAALDVPDDAGDVPAAIRDLGHRLAAALEHGPRELMGRTVREMVGNSADWVRVLDDRDPLWTKIIPLVQQGQAAGTIRDDQSPTRLAVQLTVLWLDNVVGWGERPGSRPLAQSIELSTDLWLGGARRTGTAGEGGR